VFTISTTSTNLPFKKLGVGTEARDEKLFTCQTRQATGHGRPDFSLKRKLCSVGLAPGSSFLLQRKYRRPRPVSSEVRRMNTFSALDSIPPRLNHDLYDHSYFTIFPTMFMANSTSRSPSCSPSRSPPRYTTSSPCSQITVRTANCHLVIDLLYYFSRLQ